MKNGPLLSLPVYEKTSQTRQYHADKSSSDTGTAYKPNNVGQSNLIYDTFDTVGSFVRLNKLNDIPVP